VVRLGERLGPAGARQAGLTALASDLIALLDADDAWELGKLASQLEALEARPEAGLCFGRARVVGPSGRATGERWEEPPAGTLEPEALVRLLYARNPIPTSSVIVRRRALASAGGFTSPLPLAEDWDLWLSLAGSGESFLCEPRAGIRYRRHRHGLTADTAALAEAILALHERHAGLVSAELARRVRGRDLVALARGRVRQRRYAAARAALAEAGSLDRLPMRERALGRALAVPLLRAAVGRRAPYPEVR
jgi:hypothetical protein